MEERIDRYSRSEQDAWRTRRARLKDRPRLDLDLDNNMDMIKNRLHEQNFVRQHFPNELWLIAKTRGPIMT